MDYTQPSSDFFVAKHLAEKNQFLPEPRYFFLIATAVVLWVAASTGQSSVREKKILNLARDSDGKKISFHGFLPEVRDTQIHKGGYK